MYKIFLISVLGVSSSVLQGEKESRHEELRDVVDKQEMISSERIGNIITEGTNLLLGNNYCLRVDRTEPANADVLAAIRRRLLIRTMS